jgi:hypothetical protein
LLGGLPARLEPCLLEAIDGYKGNAEGIISWLIAILGRLITILKTLIAAAFGVFQNKRITFGGWFRLTSSVLLFKGWNVYYLVRFRENQLDLDAITCLINIFFPGGDGFLNSVLIHLKLYFKDMFSTLPVNLRLWSLNKSSRTWNQRS